MKTSESEENYLEIILVLGMIKPYVRSVDVAERLNYKKSSVSVAIKKLRKKGHVVMSPEGYLSLTDSGRKIAEMIFEHHQLVYKRLIQLGVSEKTAFDDACRIEHRISGESFEAIRKHVMECHWNNQEPENPVFKKNQTSVSKSE